MIGAFAILSGAVCVGPVASGADTGGIVAGTVAQLGKTPSSAGSFQPIEGAKVRLVNVFSGATLATTQSDAKGAFSFQGVPEGAYGVEAADKTACDMSRVFHVSDDSKTIVQLRLWDKLCTGMTSFVLDATD